MKLVYGPYIAHNPYNCRGLCYFIQFNTNVYAYIFVFLFAVIILKNMKQTYDNAFDF